MEQTVNLATLMNLIVDNREDIKMNMSVSGKVLFHIELDPKQFEEATGIALNGP